MTPEVGDDARIIQAATHHRALYQDGGAGTRGRRPVMPLRAKRSGQAGRDGRREGPDSSLEHLPTP